jgi:dihydromethanopterin reductase (acceptor)
MGKIGWGITGAGHFLQETFKVIGGLAGPHEISCFVSAAGEHVVRAYGLWSRLERICPGGRYRELVLERVEGVWSPFTGRFFRKAYEALVVSPASANTVAKVVSGISDTLVTNAIAQAEKGGVPILIVPTDQRPGETKTSLPYFIDRNVCERCEGCVVIGLCRAGAIIQSGGLPKIDLSRCDGCGACLEGCPLGAVSFGREVSFTVREIDVENVKKLRRNRSFTVLADPARIPSALERVLGEVGE